MATMDPNSDAPSDAAVGEPTGSAGSYGPLFSHAEPAEPGQAVDGPTTEGTTTSETPARKKSAAKTTAKKTAAKKTTAKKTAARKTTSRKTAGTTVSDPGAGDAEGASPQADGDSTSTTGEASPDTGTGTPAPTRPGDEAAGEEAERSPSGEQEGDADGGEEQEGDADGGEEQEEGTTDTEPEESASASTSPFGLIFQAPDLSAVPARPARRTRSSAGETHADRDGASQDTDGSESGTDADAPSGAHGGRGDSQGRGQRGGRSTRSDSAGAGHDDSSEDRAVDSAHDEGNDDGDGDSQGGRRRRRRGGKGRRGRGSGSEDSGESAEAGTSGEGSEPATDTSGDTEGQDGDTSGGTVRRRRRSNRRGEDGEARESRRAREEVTGVRGSTRLEAKRQRRREGREAGRRRTIITEAEFLARRESVQRTMVVRGLEDRTQIGVLEDGVLVEHYVSRSTQTTMVGNVYLGRVQNVLPSMEAAFVDIGKGRNAVLYAGEVNWDAAGLDANVPKRIENALKSGDSVLVQVTKDPIGHKGARLTSQVSLPGRYLVLVPGNSMTGISRKLPDTERTRLKKILKDVVPEGAGVIVRTAAEGASEEELRADVERLTGLWQRIESKQKTVNAPALLHGEPDMTVRVIRDVFNEDFAKVVVSGEQAWKEVSDYLNDVAPDLADRLEKWTGTQDVFTHYRVTEALAKAMDRKVWLPSGGSLVIDRTEAMTVVDVNTGKFVGSGGNLEETVTKNNIEAAEEIVRQLRLRDIGGIIVIDFIDMVLESNRDLVVRRLLECLGRDRTKHQVAEVTSLGLVQMTRKRVGAGLIEVFSEPCVHCNGRGIVVHSEPVEKSDAHGHDHGRSGSGSGGRRGRGRSGASGGDTSPQTRPAPAPGGPTPAQIAAAAHAAAIAGAAQSQTAAESDGPDASAEPAAEATARPTPAEATGDGPVTEPTAAGAAAEPTETATTTEPLAPSPAEPAPGPAAASATVPPTAGETTPSVAAPAAAARPRKRRGRVVAPAGPPGGTGTETVPTAADGT